MTFSEFFELLGIRFAVTYRNTIEFFKIIFKYYTSWKFLQIDTYLLRSYLFKSPFKISKQFLKAKGEKELYSYGETPLTTIDLIGRECGIKKEDVVYELGSGRGRACFWLNYFIGCKVVGIENIPEFVDISRRVKNHFHLEGISFKLQDMLKADYSDATVIYFYGTTSESDFISKLIKKLEELPDNAKIITVSYPLTAFTSKSVFELEKTFPAPFTWGTADVYLQRKKKGT